MAGVCVSAMRTKIIFFFALLGFFLVCAGASQDVAESSTSTSVSVSTVTRKVTSRSFSRTPSEMPSNETVSVTEDLLKVEEKADDGLKPPRAKKKILASNLKITMPDKPERVVTPVNVTEGDSLEDATVEEIIKVENKTGNLTVKEEGKTKGDKPVEVRSLEDVSSEENVSVKTRAKTTLSTTERTTNGNYEAFGELQKALKNNFLNNNEGYDSRAIRPSPSVILPAKKPPPVSKDNSLKNAIRFEGEYYGPTAQTDWVPKIPDKLPSRSPAQHFGSKLNPVIFEKANKTSERNSIVFPSDGVQPLKDSNVIPVREIEKTATNVRSGTQNKVANSTQSTKLNATQPIKFTKFRGSVRYKQSNITVEDKQNGTTPKKNIGLDLPAMGESAGKSAMKSGQEETTEITVVSSTNHTTKSQNAVDGGLAVPPENVKMENVTKEPQLKNTIPNNSETVNHTNGDSRRLVENSQGWIPLVKVKPENDTDVIIPKLVPVNQRNETAEVKPSTIEVETAPEDITTEETVTPETPELTTLPTIASTENTNAVEIDTSIRADETVTSQNEEFVETTESVIAMTVPTTLKPTSFEDVVSVDLSTHSVEPVVYTTKSAVTTQSATAAAPVSTSSLTIATTTPLAIPVTKATTAGVSYANNLTTKTTTATTAITETTTKGITVITISETTTHPSSPAPSTTPSASTSKTLPPPPTTKTTTSTVSSTTVKIQETSGKPDVTEQGIYYKNYIPTTINPHDEITEENVPAYLRLTIQAKSWEELCRLKDDLREAVMNMLGGNNVSAESVHFLNLNDRKCQGKIEETRGQLSNGTVFLPVNMFLMDKNGDFDKNLSEAFLTLWGRRGLDFELPIRKVDFVTPIVKLTELADSPLGGSVVAAIVISCVAGICVILLGILFVVMKRRQKRFNYGQRCTPVSLDAYSLDSVSIYNSVRRKAVRASKRSYGNAAFDDPEIPTHPMNFAGLANFSSDKEQLYEEFNIIPQVYPKVEELPPGAETKNRYANIIPLPETRVHLTIKDGDPLSDYINANYVRGLKGAEKLYIACQAPMESTVEDFWRMVWEQQSKVILMLTDLEENGIEKCADYLPPNEVTDNLRLFGDFQVTLKKRDVKEKYIISNLKLKNMEANLWREVTHLWYLGWPDQGVPSEANSLIAFLIEARSQMKIQNGASTSSPVLVHCSPGTGRTGTVIACDLCIREYEQSRMVDIPKCVFNLRKDRAGAVQTKDQYAFIYQVLNVYATKLSGGGIESI